MCYWWLVEILRGKSLIGLLLGEIGLLFWVFYVKYWLINLLFFGFGEWFSVIFWSWFSILLNFCVGVVWEDDFVLFFENVFIVKGFGFKLYGGWGSGLDFE